MADLSKYKFYALKDAKHGRSIVAGDLLDGHVYHQDRGGRINGEWCFVPTGEKDYFYIVDRRDNRGIAAGEAGPGQLYHQAYEGRAVAQWKATPGLQPGAFRLTDRQHQKVIAAPDGVGMDLYHQDPGNRPNAEWLLEQVVSGGTAGPKFFPESVKVTKMDFQYGSATSVDQPDAFDLPDSPYENNGTGELSETLHHDWSETQSETFSFERSLSTTILKEIALSFGAKAIADTGEASIEIKETKGESHTETSSEGRSVTRTRTLGGRLETRVVIPPGQKVSVSCHVSRQLRAIPFRATLRITYADGSQGKDEVSGTWEGTVVSGSRVSVNQVR